MGLPELWTIVLDQMAADSSLATPADARAISSPAGWVMLVARARHGNLSPTVVARRGEGRDPPGYFERADPVVARLIAYRPVQVILAAQRIVWDLASGRRARLPGQAVPR